MKKNLRNTHCLCLINGLWYEYIQNNMQYNEYFSIKQYQPCFVPSFINSILQYNHDIVIKICYINRMYAFLYLIQSYILLLHNWTFSWKNKPKKKTDTVILFFTFHANPHSREHIELIKCPRIAVNTIDIFFLYLWPSIWVREKKK